MNSEDEARLKIHMVMLNLQILENQAAIMHALGGLLVNQDISNCVESLLSASKSTEDALNKVVAFVDSVVVKLNVA